MSWGIVAGAAIGVVGSVVSGNKSASASRRATDATVGEQARQYDQTRADFAPARNLGNAAISDINRLYGRSTAQPLSYSDWASQNGGFAAPAGGMDTGSRPFGMPGNLSGLIAGRSATNEGYQQYLQDFESTPTSTGKPDMSVFFNSPDYAFNLAEGQKAIDRSLVSRGRGLSGSGVRAGVRYAQGLASTEFGNFYNRLASQAGLGQAATGSTAAAGANAANTISGAYMQNGANQAQIAQNTYSGINNSVQGGIQNYLLQRYLSGGSSASTLGP